eukprot:576600_1
MAHLYEGTEGIGGEDDEEDASTPTLKEFIAQQNISSDIDIYAKLTEMGIDWTTLLHIEPGDLEVLAKEEMNLPFKIKIKFKSAVKSMQSTYKPITESVIEISSSESEEIRKLKKAMQQTKQMNKLLKKHKDQIKHHSTTLKAQIDKTFEDIVSRLEARKQSLWTKVDEWVQSKLQSMDKEISDGVESHTLFVDEKKKCDDLLRNSANNKQREQKIVQIVKGSLNTNEKCTQYAETDSLIAYIKSKTSLIEIAFAEDVFGARAVNAFGKVRTDGENELIKIASIHLDDPIVASKDNDGYCVKLRWQMAGGAAAHAHNENSFDVKYCEDEDDEKKRNEMPWISADIKDHIQNGSQFGADISNKYLFGKQYKYKVVLDMNEPIQYQIQSNIVQFIRKGARKGPVVKIELKEHSNRKHYRDWRPSNLLQDNDNYYASALNRDFKANENDWIIFKLKQENTLYLPTKCMVKNRYNNYGRNVRQMKLWIGDGKKQWFAFNVLDVANNNQKQEFELNRLDWTVANIKRHSLRFIKLEFLQNHGFTGAGGCKFILKQFELFGQ